MGSNSNSDLRFEQRNANLLNYQPSDVCSVLQRGDVLRNTMSSIEAAAPCSPVGTVNSFFVSSRDPFISTTQNVGSKGKFASFCQKTVSPYNVGAIGNQENDNISAELGMGERFSHLVRYPSDMGFFEQESKLPCFGSRSFSKFISPFAASVSDYQLSDHSSTEGKCSVAALSKGNSEHKCDLANQELCPSPGNPVSLEEISGKKRKWTLECHTPDSKFQFDVVRSIEKDPSKAIAHVSGEASKENGDNKQKNEQGPTSNTSKITGKQAKGRSQSTNPPKEDYIHIRARRGQATNSHSLAERMRREKISERMRFLQDLVPGCSKVTGKAVMLDEIINYVQSLQRQVEFLSMKMATVSAEINFDIDQLLSKDILYSQSSGSTVLGFGPALGSIPGTIEAGTGIPNIENLGVFSRSLNSQLTAMDHHTSTLWDDELQSIIQMGFTSNSPFDDPENGSTQVEL